MAQGGVPTKPPTFTTRDWGAWVRQLWSDDWHKPEIAYRFQNGRTFNDSGIRRGVYVGVHPGDAILQEGNAFKAGEGDIMQEDGLGRILQE